jgi:hypothetical protein
MTTSLTQSSISALPSDGKPTADQFIYFARRFKNELHNEVLRRFIEEQRVNNLTKAELARRLGRDPAQVNRWLGAPKNWETETVSQLLLAMGYLPTISSVKLGAQRSNHFDCNDVLPYDQKVTSGSASPKAALFEDPVKVNK